MAYQLLERPYKFSFAGNPVKYVFNITNPETPGCALEIELYSIAIWQNLQVGDFGDLITRQTLYPNPDGKVLFYCEDFLNSFLEWEMPSLQYNEVLGVDKQIRKFYVRYRQVTTGSPSPAWATDSDHMLVVLKGGIAKEKFDRNNFFLNYLPSKKPFLTWQPDDHFIGRDERRYLTYFHYADEMPELFLKARVVYTDGVQQTATLAFPPLSVSRLFRLPAGLDQLGLAAANPGKQVWFYDVSVEDADGNIFANPYRLYVDYTPYYKVFSFIYANSISGFDTLRIRGDYDIEFNRDFTDIIQAAGDYAGELLPTEVGIINISKFEIYKGDAGYFNTAKMQDSLQDLLLSDHVFRLVAGRWLRVVNTQKTQPLRAKSDTKWSFPLQWRYTFDNSHYTPEEMEFGTGTSDDIAGDLYGLCTAPGNLKVELVGPDGDGTKYRFSWDDVSGALGYEFYFKPLLGWTKIDTETNSIEHTFSNTGDYSWRVRTKCGPDDFSGYAFGPGFHLDVSAPMCDVPLTLALLLLSIDGSNATLRAQWSSVSGRQGSIYEWREVGASTWLNVFTPYTNYEITVKKDVQYEHRVRTYCGTDETGDHYSKFLYGENFIASNLVGSCNPPSGLGVVINSIATIGTGTSLATFNWTNSGGGSQYEIQYREKGTSTWTVKDNVQAGMFVQILINKTWEWRLRTHCNGGGLSNFINGPDFNT